jgi:prepilin-type N-terminal cleavage/methylation domain-containing protein/prepilin-type processing-associated H-X9-DG protein
MERPNSSKLATAGRRSGFTLVELMTVITVIGLLVAILLPVIQRVRENARDTQCKSNLKQLAQGLIQYSTSSPSGSYCSGAWDWKRDGAVTQVGWVADLVNHGILPGDLLCPSSPARLSRVYHELLTMDGAANTCADSLGRGDQFLPDGTVVKNPCRQLAGATNKGEILNDLLLLKGFNTNYATSWFLVRSEVNIDPRGALVNSNTGCALNQRERSCTVGPLTTSRVGGGRAPANTVPILGCASLSDEGEHMLSEKVGEYDVDTLLADSYTTGPRDKTTLAAPTITGGGVGARAWFGPWNGTLQDFRAFGPIHGSKKKGSCNIAFLDGAVKVFVDENGDELLNNGFPQSTRSGFQDDVIELPLTEVHSLWSMDPARIP